MDCVFVLVVVVAENEQDGLAGRRLTGVRGVSGFKFGVCVNSLACRRKSWQSLLPSTASLACWPCS